MKRECGGCTLCCKLLPIPPLNKLAGIKCKFQRHNKGCTVHGTVEQPRACQVWHCRWLLNDDAGKLSRPDRAHYVIDMLPDEITIQPDDKSEPPKKYIAVQVWIDPDYPEAWKQDDELFAWVLRKAEHGIPTLLRINKGEARQGIGLIAPPITGKGWVISEGTINMSMGLWK